VCIWCHLGKFLSFIVQYPGIEIDQAKIKAIQEMPTLKNLKELQGLQGRLAYIRRFISIFSSRRHPFHHLMKRDTQFELDKSCWKAFESIKRYLSNPPILGASIPGKPLRLYIAAQERSLGVLYTEENEESKKRALNYLSRTLVWLSCSPFKN